MKTTTLLVALLLAVTGGASRAATDLVANGSFELGTANIGSFQGWQTALGDTGTFVDSTGQTGSHVGQASDGLWFAFFGSTAASGGSAISQALATVAGQSYQLSFDLANDNAGQTVANSLSVRVGGNTLLSFANLNSADYKTYTTTFTAVDTSAVLGFNAFNDVGYLELDHVSVAVVPEPATVALMLIGLALIGHKRLRRSLFADH